MKKLFILVLGVGMLSLTACNRRATCPAYGQLVKPAGSAVHV